MSSPASDVSTSVESGLPRRWQLVLALCAIVLFLIVALTAVSGVPFRNDFAAYWPVGRLLLAGQNPYDAGAIEALQRSVGDTLGGDSVVRYPPWALPLLLPFAALPYVPAWYLWIFFQAVVVGISSVWLWRLLGGKQGRGVALAIGMLFPPTLIMALGGQIGGILLLASTAFLWAADSRRDLLAGICLWVLATKPHLFMLLGIIVVLWAIHERRLMVPAVAGLTIAAGSLVSIALRPDVFREYVQFLQTGAPTGYLPVTLGGLARLIGGTEKFWIQWIPSLVILALIPVAWSRVKRTWLWIAYGPAILALGLISGPYGLVHDLVILIPCLLLIAVRSRRVSDDVVKRLVLWGYVAVCVGIWIGQLRAGTSFAQVWVAPLVPVVCIAFRRSSAGDSVTPVTESQFGPGK